MHRESIHVLGVVCSWLILTGLGAGAFADDPPVQPDVSNVRLPLPFQVIQRDGYEPEKAHEHQPGGPALGHADVAIAAKLPVEKDDLTEYRVVALADAYGTGSEWTPFAGKSVDGELVAAVRVSAGGWYRLELRARRAEIVTATAHLQPFGVGEVLVVAGQSYAEGANDELLRISERGGRVAAYDRIKTAWQVANDPQPNAGTGGTIWPPLGDLLVPLLRVPVGFVNVAVGGTASRQWLPGETLYQNLAAAGKATGRFRAVLWQQGESDVIEKVSTETYVKHLTLIRSELAKDWGFEPPWLLAKSTLHPTVYNDPAGEGKIREAIVSLCRLPGFRPGPDTDTLGGENRGGLGTRRHFTGIGQRRAALLWFAALWPEIGKE